METTNLNLLVIDDEKNTRTGLAQGLRKVAASVVTAADASEGLALFAKQRHDIVITDLRLPGELDGLDVVRQVLDKSPDTRVIVTTTADFAETSEEAMRLGAFDLVTKPVDLDVIQQQVRRAAEQRKLVGENCRLRDGLAATSQIPEIIGNCAATQDMLQLIRQVSQTDATVLLLGESGTGKDLTARAIHRLSELRSQPFVSVNFGRLPEHLTESKLFRDEKGGFTGAKRAENGHSATVADGTLFLDEITEADAKTQLALQRLLEERESDRDGAEEMLSANWRIISAASRDIEQWVQAGKFREDLYYRLNVVPIRLPALRERRDDIPLLVEHFLEHFCRRHRRDLKRFTAPAMISLSSRKWPGNIRQLKNLVERLVVTTTGETIRLEDIPEECQSAANTGVCSLADAVEEAERNAILAALSQCGYHREQTAKLLAISVRSLHYKMSRYGLH